MHLGIRIHPFRTSDLHGININMWRKDEENG
jgi:hypothetical protein